MVHFFGTKGAPPNGPLVSSWIASLTSTSALSTYTFTSASLGTAATDRVILVGVGNTKATAAITPTGVTIAGITATQLSTGVNGSSGTNPPGVSWWWASVPTGTTGNIVVTFGSSVLQCECTTFRITGCPNGIVLTQASAGSTPSTASPVTGAVNVVAGGSAFAFVGSVSSSSYTWTGITERNDYVDGGRTWSSASGDFASAQTPLNCVATGGSGDYKAFSAISIAAA